MGKKMIRDKKLEKLAREGAQQQFPAGCDIADTIPAELYDGEPPHQGVNPVCGKAVVVFAKGFVLGITAYKGGIWALDIRYPNNGAAEAEGAGVCVGPTGGSLDAAGKNLFASKGVPGRVLIAPYFGLPITHPDDQPNAAESSSVGKSSLLDVQAILAAERAEDEAAAAAEASKTSPASTTPPPAPATAPPVVP